MNKNILSVLLLFLMVITAQAQIKGEANYLIKYEVNFVLDSTNREDVKHEVHRLYTGSTVSNYLSEGRFLRDSMMLSMRNQSRNATRRMSANMQNMPTSEFNPIVFKDFANSEVWIKHSLIRDHYLYEEQEVPIQWEFIDESKEIESYTVQKATTNFGGRDWEAWFTLEIPIVDGPYVFSGLPGLILELYDTDMDYHFNLASLAPLEVAYSIDSEDGGSYKKVSKADFVKAYKSYQKNPSASVTRNLPANFEVTEADGRKVTVKDIERQAKERVAKRNNQIEIW